MDERLSQKWPNVEHCLLNHDDSVDHCDWEVSDQGVDAAQDEKDVEQGEFRLIWCWILDLFLAFVFFQSIWVNNLIGRDIRSLSRWLGDRKANVEHVKHIKPVHEVVHYAGEEADESEWLDVLKNEGNLEDEWYKHD